MARPFDDDTRRWRPDPGKLGGASDPDAPASDWPGKRPEVTSRVSRRGDGAVGPSAADALDRAAGSTGTGLPDLLRGRLESSLDADLGGVRVHTGDASQTAARSIGAQAYTVGQDVHFAPGTYAPGSREGDALIAHEVAHTVQQQGAPADVRQPKLEVSGPADAHEIEAEAFAQAFVDGRAAQVGAVRAGTVSRAVVHRKPPDAGFGGPKTEQEFNRAGVEDVRARAQVLLLKITAFQGEAAEAQEQLKGKVLGFAKNYKEAYEKFAEVLAEARERARNIQEMKELAEEIALGILIAVTAGAVIEVAAGASLLAEVGAGVANGVIQHAGVDAAMHVVKPTTGGTDLEVTAVDPQTVDMKSYRALSDFSGAVAKVNAHADSASNLSAVAEYCIGEIKAQLGDGSQSDMGEADVLQMAQSIVAAGSHLGAASAGLDRAEAKLAGVKAVVGATPDLDAVEIEKKIWTKWMSEQKPSERVIDLDPIENHLRELGLVGWKLFFYSEGDEARDIDNAKERGDKQHMDDLTLQGKQQAAVNKAEADAAEKQKKEKNEIPDDPNAPNISGADTKGNHTPEEFKMAQVEALRGKAATAAAQFAICDGTGSLVQKGISDGFQKYWVAYNEAYGTYARVIAQGKQAARDKNELSKHVSGYVFAGIAGGVAGGVEAAHHGAEHAHAAGSALGAFAKKVGAAAAEKVPEGGATAVAGKKLENEGADMKPTAITPDGIDASMFKQLSDLGDALNAVSQSKLQIALVLGAAEYCLGEIKGHLSHGAADNSVDDVKKMVDMIIGQNGNVTDAAHDADELLRALKTTQAQTASLNPSSAVLEKEIWVLWMATLEPDKRILDIDPIEDHLANLGLVTKTWYYSKNDETKDIERAKGAAKDLEARRAEAGIGGGGGE